MGGVPTAAGVVEDDVSAPGEVAADEDVLVGELDVEVLAEVLARVLDDGGRLDDVPAEVDAEEEDVVEVDEDVLGTEVWDVCFASTGRVEVVFERGPVVAPDAPVLGGWLLAGGLPDPPSRTKPPRTSRPTTTAAARIPTRWLERCGRGAGSAAGSGATRGSGIGGPTAAATGASGTAWVAASRNVRATASAEGRAAGSRAVIAARRPGHGAGSDGGIAGGRSRCASMVAIWPSPSYARCPVSASSKVRPRE
jgi:hypothetical protein